MQLNTDSRRLRRHALDILAYRERLTPEQWIATHCELTPKVTDFHPGPASLRYFPYMRRILQVMADPRTRRVTLDFGSQLIKTTIVYLFLAWSICNRPRSIGYFLPAERDIKIFCQNKWYDLWTYEYRGKKYPRNAALAAELPLMADGSVNEDLFTYTVQKFRRCNMTLLGTGVDIAVKSQPYDILVLDETTEIERRRCEQAADRIKGRPRGLIIETSSPGEEPCYITDQRLAGTDEHYHVPCPHCGQPFEILWREHRDSGPYYFHADPAALGTTDNPEAYNLRQIAETTWLECAHCQGEIRNAQKQSLLDAGQWIPNNPNGTPGHYSFHLSSLYSPILPWGAALSDWYKSLGNRDALYRFTTGFLAQTWRDTATPTNPGKLKSCAGDYQRGDPRGDARLIIVDVQRADLRYNIRGYSGGKLSELIDHGSAASFKDIADLQDKYKADHVGIDVQYPERQQEAYEAIHANQGRGWFGILGKKSGTHIARTTPFRETSVGAFTGKKRGRFAPSDAITVLHINGDMWKAEMAKARNAENPNWKVYTDPHPSYIRELYAEYQTQKRNPRTGRDENVWKVKAHGQNHQGDCETYQFAAATWLGLLTTANTSAIASVLKSIAARAQPATPDDGSTPTTAKPPSKLQQALNARKT